MIRDAYLDTLHNKGYIDQHETLPWTVHDMPGQKLWIKKLLFFGIYEPKPVERCLIKALCHMCPDSTFFAMHLNGSPAFKDDYSWLNPSMTRDLPISSRDKVVAGIFVNKSRSEGTVIRSGSFKDAREEMRAIASEIKGLIAKGVEPERIGVLLPMRSKSSPLAREVFSDFGIPVNIRVPIKFSEAPIINDVINILETVKNDYPAEDLIGVLSSPFVRFRFKLGKQDFQLLADSVRAYVQQNGLKGGKVKWTEAASSAVQENMWGNVPDAQLKSGLKSLISLLDGLNGERSISDHIRSLRKVLDMS